MNHNKKMICAALVALVWSASSSATTKGLSQIVTPDLQDPGALSVSAQLQSRAIANPYQLQAELGLTRWFEVAMFQGLSPGEEIFGSEIGLYNQGPWLLTAGFINWSTRGVRSQPFLEGGYYTESDKFMGGPIQAHGKTELLLGWAHDFDPRWRFQLDYQSGGDNYVTAGFTCNVTPAFQFNPAVYVSNNDASHAVGYIVFTYTLPVWKP
ncbi:MAG TPA: hypothetical protein VHE37_00900 [Nevskiaceae bacterium]|nr:hypothetical protein [Nevskiaceae bacterium]